ncbi:hypothetical protein B0I37DRAFT_381170 [Chaetomium sp. MPI-CAGE-AT-0009]|nr:hypothetical protein B0I37DRAFT_381170 [Chaetomium sp. MPI-CAGE-AT-0009]
MSCSDRAHRDNFSPASMVLSEETRSQIISWSIKRTTPRFSTFGCGLTEGWVQPPMFHTEEGDLHAVATMKEGLLHQGTNGGNEAGTK